MTHRLPNTPSIARIAFSILLIAVVLVTTAEQSPPLGSAATPPPPTLSTPSEILRRTTHIFTPDGIEKQHMVRIGGIDQWISVRGRHRGNPILLFLHGGPGFTSIPHSYYFMAGWDEYFTFVQWDQRGAGKTFEANAPETVGPTLSIDRMLADAEELVTYLMRSYGSRRIVLMAHSWGTVLGVKLVQRHPGWFYAYVGMGQIVDMARSEAMGYQATLAAARADNNGKAVAELEALAPWPDPDHPQRVLEQLGQERHWLEHYDGDEQHETGDELMQFSPDYTAQDRRARSDGLLYSAASLWGPLGSVTFSRATHFGCPVILMQGRRDLTTSATLVRQWFRQLEAPRKRLIWFEDSGHNVYEEEPAKVLVTLVREVLPLTAR
jgi:pimeloyl-ACP methyl ester carboxylesterase